MSDDCRTALPVSRSSTTPTADGKIGTFAR
jgi:hypothetical protein